MGNGVKGEIHLPERLSLCADEGIKLYSRSEQAGHDTTEPYTAAYAQMV